MASYHGNVHRRLVSFAVDGDRSDTQSLSRSHDTTSNLSSVSYQYLIKIIRASLSSRGLSPRRIIT